MLCMAPSDDVAGLGSISGSYRNSWQEPLKHLQCYILLASQQHVQPQQTSGIKKNTKQCHTREQISGNTVLKPHNSIQK